MTRTSTTSLAERLCRAALRTVVPALTFNCAVSKLYLQQVETRTELDKVHLHHTFHILNSITSVLRETDLTWAPPPLRINRSMENVGNVIRRTPWAVSVCSCVHSVSSLSSSVQAWWVTRTTRTASLTTSNAAVPEQFHRQHDELGSTTQTP